MNRLKTKILDETMQLGHNTENQLGVFTPNEEKQARYANVTEEDDS